MPILKDNRPIKQLSLPESNITLKIKDGFIAADLEVIMAEQNQVRQSMALIARMITEWDAQGEDGQTLPISAENVALLPITDLKFIQDNLNVVESFLAQAAKPDMK